MTSRPSLDTWVAHAGWTDHRFRGYAQFGELAGHTDFWSFIALAVGAARLSDEACAVLDDLLACCSLSDPRIPPVKIVRTAAAYGSGGLAVAVGLLPYEGARLGPWPSGACAADLQGLLAALGPDGLTPERVDAALRARLDRGQRFVGFGVPFRDLDERVQAMNACLERRGLAGRPHWKLLMLMDEALARLKGWPANIAGACAATLLDLGFQPPQISMVGVLLAMVAVVSNAYEGAEQAPPALRSLPADRVAYRGAAPRASPRSR